MTEERNLQRRVAGFHDIRMDGMTDLVIRAKGASVFDIGCNRGLVSFEMANNGARLVHGCDIFAEGVQTAREIFADLRGCESRFEVIDLTGGPNAVTNAFGDMRYDIVLCLATLHKLRRLMKAAEAEELMRHFGQRAQKYFGWRATSNSPEGNEDEMKLLDNWLGQVGLKRVHTSYISEELALCAVWKRV